MQKTDPTSHPSTEGKTQLNEATRESKPSIERIVSTRLFLVMAATIVFFLLVFSYFSIVEIQNRSRQKAENVADYFFSQISNVGAGPEFQNTVSYVSGSMDIAEIYAIKNSKTIVATNKRSLLDADIRVLPEKVQNWIMTDATNSKLLHLNWWQRTYEIIVSIPILNRAHIKKATFYIKFDIKKDVATWIETSLLVSIFIVSIFVAYLFAVTNLFGKFIFIPLKDMANLARNQDFEGFRTFNQRAISTEMSDISQVLLASFEANAAKQEELKSALKAKSQFLANMSHEIRTPMNGILGTADLLSETKLDTEQKRLVQVISESSQSMLTILNDILDYSKVEFGMMTVEAHDFNIRLLIDSTAMLFRNFARQKDLEFNVTIDNPHTDWIYSDSHRIRQVIVNLINNAIKFTEAGSISIQASLSALQSKYTLEITVRDTGIGIDKAMQNTIFNMFTQADASTTRKYGGTGLGLNLSKKIVDLLGGTLILTSAKGQGTTVELRIPVEIGQAQASTGDRDDQAPTSFEHLKVLVAEDNKINQSLVLAFLEKFGIRADLAEDGQEALDLAIKTNYNVIFMDCHMPNMDGFEATKHIRALNQIPRPYIIALTANIVDGIREECVVAGMDHYLSKPFRKSHLAEILNKIS